MAGANKLRLERIRGHSFIPALLPGDCVVVDLGANQGDFSRSIRREFGWRCFAVEASPSVFEKIEADQGLQKFNVAITDRDGPVRLFLSQNSEESSIIGSGGEFAAGMVVVEGVTLSTFMARAGIARIDLLKIDIEGAEVGLFDTLTDAQLEAIRQISAEFHDFNGRISRADVKRIIARLAQLGFEYLKMSATTNGDLLFVNRRLADVSWVRWWGLKAVDRNIIFVRRLWERVRARTGPRPSREPTMSSTAR